MAETGGSIVNWSSWRPGVLRADRRRTARPRPGLLAPRASSRSGSMIRNRSRFIDARHSPRGMGQVPAWTRRTRRSARGHQAAHRRPVDDRAPRFRPWRYRVLHAQEDTLELMAMSLVVLGSTDVGEAAWARPARPRVAQDVESSVTIGCLGHEPPRRGLGHVGVHGRITSGRSPRCLLGAATSRDDAAPSRARRSAVDFPCRSRPGDDRPCRPSAIRPPLPEDLPS